MLAAPTLPLLQLRPALSISRSLPVAMSGTPPRPVAFGALAFYFGFFFLSDVPPGPNVLNTPPEFLSTVLDLSLNFFFILPLTTPGAPVVDPMYEAIFNSAIAFSLLFVGFATDGRKKADDARLGENAFVPFLAAMPFATNLAYLAYLGARPAPADEPPSRPLNWLEEVGESPVLPVALVGMLALSLSWGVFGRADAFGPPSERLMLLQQLLSTERLAYALLGDCAFFGVFQGWMLEDDLARREHIDDAERARLLTVGRFVPYLGLAYYLLARPRLRS